MKQRWFLVVLAVVLAPLSYGSEMLITTYDGRTFVFDVDPEESIGALQDRIGALEEMDSESYVVEAAPRLGAMSIAANGGQGKELGYPRDYCSEVTYEEMVDIRYIVTSLANKPLLSIALIKSDLEAAGDRIDHLHPLRFLMTVFTDEELKVGIRNIRGRGWVWKHFVGGLKNCMSTESRIGNMCDEHIIHFSDVVQVDPENALELVSTHQWDAFIEYLIRAVPRDGDHDRYDS